MSEFRIATPENEEIMSRLKRQWESLVEEVGGKTHLVNEEFQKMVFEYQKGEGRSYHNISHIGKVDEILNKYKGLSNNWIALKFAGDGHDVVYLPGSATNEADSALYMRETMKRLGMPESIISKTEKLILVTKDHKSDSLDIDEQLMIDADFAIFATNPSEYDAYARGIWQEYVGTGKYTQEAFRAGRGGLIESWLSQDRIFLVDEIRTDLEPIARENLLRERKMLAV